MFIVVRVNRRIRHTANQARARTHTQQTFPLLIIRIHFCYGQFEAQKRANAFAMREKKFTFGFVNKKSNKNFTRIVRTYFNMRYQNIYTISLTLTTSIPSLILCLSLLEPEQCCSFMACNSHYYFYYHRQFYKSKRNTQFAYNLHNANTLCVSRTICFM